MSRFLLPGLLVPVLLASCGTMDTLKSTATNAGKSIGQFSISDLRPARVGVVEVREKDLQEMQTGKERALAFDQKRKRAFWSFSLPNFKEPTLPKISDGDMDGSLLPPKPL